jgi:hypothetical protein
MSLHSRLKLLFLILITALITTMVPAQMEGLHGDQRYSYNGVHSGNWIRTSFYNDGMVGIRYVNPDDIRGEWPINTGRSYINQLIMFVGAEVRDTDGEIRHIISEGNGCTAGNLDQADSGDAGPGGEWWSMAPLPGFANDDEKRIAMSHWDWSWPASWPDKFEGETIDPGWPDSWNGYFGKNVLNADQESYYVIDDYNNREWKFYPDDNDQSRRGLGLRGTVRGFQWSSIVVQDVLFFLYDIENIGTYNHKKMNFGIMSGPIMGTHTATPGDGGDDGGMFNLEENLGWHYDEDGVGSGGWTWVALHGLAFFESPGNPYDGIDNDGDGEMGSGKIITEAMFDPVTFQVNDPVVVIDYITYERTVQPMPAEGVVVTYIGREYTFMPDSVLVEIENNLIDDNLNGLIDESNGSTFGEGEEAITYYLYENLKCVDYVSGNGLDNPLIDEKRDDNIDNDGDWDPLFDDVGLDGVPGTGDPGEEDGRPTSGIDTDLPGEPHIDKTDIDESDMIGLTAFNIYTPWTLYPLRDDENLWNGIAPGYLNAREDYYGDTDIMLGSGYFPLQPEQIERFSLGILFGESDANHDTGDLFRNKQFAEKAYLENYNFAKAPLIPTLKAIPGDNQVTLIWDNLSEKSYDPLSGFDFEGYRIYRSTDKTWGDMRNVTDGRGIAQSKEPMVQFDLDNEYEGYSIADVNGVKFYLGSNTGIVNTWTDTTAKNGYTYYYAVTSYDHGELEIAPIECSKYISVSPGGRQVDLGQNVVVAKPEAPSAGYIPAGADSMILQPGGTTTGKVHLNIFDPSQVPENHTYQVTFEDTIIEINNDPLPMTKTITLTDITDASNPVTLVDRDTLVYTGDQLPIVQGFQLFLENEEALAANEELSEWNNPNIFDFLFELYSYSRVDGVGQPADYRIDFGEVGFGHSTKFMRGSRELPEVDVNFKITNLTQDTEIEFGFYELAGEDGRFSADTTINRADQIIFLEMVNDTLRPTWVFRLSTAADSYDTTTVNPDVGDYIYIRLNKPFLSHDVFEFTTQGEHTDKELAKKDLDKIKVVPNPYIVSASWEQENPYTTGRGPRELHFTHLPPKCTIRIFNVLGQLVVTLEHNSDLWDGTAVWDMMTKDKLDVAYGVYIYHVDAEGIGEKIGKFAIIK